MYPKIFYHLKVKSAKLGQRGEEEGSSNLMGHMVSFGRPMEKLLFALGAKAGCSIAELCWPPLLWTSSHERIHGHWTDMDVQTGA